MACIGQPKTWHAQWIGFQNDNANSTPNLWTCYRKDFTIDKAPQSVKTWIAADSKYWLWVNGKLVLREGGLKRGPSPKDTYFDELDIAPWLQKGKNTIAILTWYWGKSGFSHNSTEKSALLFEAALDTAYHLLSDKTWRIRRNPAFGHTDKPHPNYRLPEPNILYDAREELPTWTNIDYPTQFWEVPQEFGVPPVTHWYKLVKRPIPFFKDYGLQHYARTRHHRSKQSDSIVAELPYNAQVTPYLKIKARAGLKIDICTDNLYVGNRQTPSVRAEYITKDGEQTFEAWGWMNGHKVIYKIPAGVKVLDLKYRETGYNTAFAGSFCSNDLFLNKLWQKSQRTLYLNMRDNYMDCPDRERAQWWGDVVLEMGEAFYALDTTANQLSRKAIHELINWQRNDSVLFSPIPGNYSKELPNQMLASVGQYGIWTYFMYTNDTATVRLAYPHIKAYLALFKTDSTGLVQHRKGGWDWSDWGTNIDVPLLDNGWYSLALQGAINMAKLSGNGQDVAVYEQKLKLLHEAFNQTYWQGHAYRSPTYQGETDDRGQALAVLAGIADTAKWDALRTVLQAQYNASPYMEKYVLEALYHMHKPDEALARMKKRYDKMVKSELTTLWELWDLTPQSTNNHGWTGGPLTLLSQYAAGIAPVEPGYTKFKVRPQMGKLKTIHAHTETVKGKLTVDIHKQTDKFRLQLHAPQGTTAVVGIPASTKPYKTIRLNGNLVWRADQKMNHINCLGEKEGYYWFEVKGGKWRFRAK